MFFEDASYKWSVDIVEKFCGIPVPDWGEFHDFNHLKGKFSTAGRYGAARADQRWLRAPAGFSGLRTKGFSWDAWTSGIAAPEAGFRFRANQSRRSSCWNLRGTNSSRSGRQRRTVAGSADLGCTITFAGRHFVPILPFGNSFAESPFRVSSCHWQLERVSSKRMVAVR